MRCEVWGLPPSPLRASGSEAEVFFIRWQEIHIFILNKDSFLKRLWRVLRVFLVLYIGIYPRYGGGKEHVDMSTDPRYGSTKLEEVIAFPEPIGNVAATKDTSAEVRVFFTVHPESRPDSNKLLEITDGNARSYPDRATQERFKTPLGVFTDTHHRLWVIDCGSQTEKGKSTRINTALPPGPASYQIAGAG